MIDFNKIKDWNESIKKNQDKLQLETDFKIKEKLRLKIRILELRVKIERLNY
jgi:hypothetical protein